MSSLIQVITEGDRLAVRSNKLEGLQVGRAVAAIMVAAFHANVFILPNRLYDDETAGLVFNMGYAGVEYFFVLSGFIMYHIHSVDIGQPNMALPFLKRRCVRIYPVYWIVLASLLILYAIIPSRGPDNADDPAAVITSFLLLPIPTAPIMQVAWTLQHEMLFYIVFMGMIFTRVAGTILFLLWMLLCFFDAFFQFNEYPKNFIFSPYNNLFLFGVIAASSYKRISLTAAAPLFIIGTTVFAAIGLTEVFDLLDWSIAYRTWAYGIGAAVIISALAATGWRFYPWLLLIGESSYSIYLVHLPVMGLFAVSFKSIGLQSYLPPTLGLGVLVSVSVLIGILVHLTVERPIINYFKNK